MTKKVSNQNFGYLKWKFGFEENSLALLPKFLKENPLFSKEKLRKSNFDIESEPIIPNFFWGENNLLADFIPFIKTFNICPENSPEISESESIKLKELLSKLNDDKKIIIGTSGNFISGIDSQLFDLLINFG